MVLEGKKEPGFSDLLAAAKPLNPPPMPEGRPKKIRVFVDRDREYYHEENRLKQAVVVHATELQINFELSVDKVAEWVAQANVIAENEVTIAAITKRRYLIIMPEGVAPETLIEAIPYDIWDLGLTFQKWDPMEDAEKTVPRFRAIVDLVGIPPPLYRENHVINAVSSFGLYLGSIAQRKSEDISTWSVVVATMKLEDIPLEVGMVAGGVEHPVQVRPVNWSEGPIYTEEDFPVVPKKYSKPAKPPKQDEAGLSDGSRTYGPDKEGDDDSEKIYMSKRVLMELCRDVDPELLPLEVREVIAGNQPERTRWNSEQDSEHATPKFTQDLATTDQQENDVAASQVLNQRLKSIICVPQQIRQEEQEVQTVISPCQKRTEEDTRGQFLNLGKEQLLGFDVATGDEETLQGERDYTSEAPATPKETQDVHQTVDNSIPTELASPRQERQEDQMGKKASVFSPPTTSRKRKRVGKDGFSPDKEVQQLMEATPLRILTRNKDSPDVTLQEVRRSVLLKRKTHNMGLMGAGPAGPSKKSVTSAQTTEVQVSLGVGGPYQMQIEKDQLEALAKVTGVATNLLDQIIQEDNADRQAQKENQEDENESEPESDWGDHASPETDADSETGSDKDSEADEAEGSEQED